jgi:branched-subunit amino acid aminotransferase/4-amino-4-deoxychorismate lyase
MSIAYYDGHLVEKNSLHVGLSDYGFIRGLTIFELSRVYNGIPFRLDDHLARLQAGTTALGLSLPVSTQKLREMSLEICTKNKFRDSCLKFYFTAGEPKLSPHSFVGDHDFSSHLLIMEDEFRPKHPHAPYGLDLYKRGYALKTVPHERALPSIKSINYMQGYVASRDAGPAYDDILFVHRNGYVTESTRSNFFCVIDGVLCTPDKDMLLGVTRKVVLELADHLKIPFSEKSLMPADVMRASEAFISGSVAELVPARSIDGHNFLTTMDGPIFSKIREAFSGIISTERIAA